MKRRGWVQTLTVLVALGMLWAIGGCGKKEDTAVKEANEAAKFTQKYKCKTCGYIYDPDSPPPASKCGVNIAPGSTPFEQIQKWLADQYKCPGCGGLASNYEPAK